MNILKSLRDIWLGIGSVKDKSVGSGSVSVEGTDKVKSIEKFASEDSVVFEKKLDETLNKLGQNDNKHRDTLLDFVYDIVNRESQVYSNFSGNSNFKYSTFVNSDIVNHHFEVSFDGKKGMVVDAVTTKLGAVLSFETKYRSDISEYLFFNRDIKSNSKLGTTVIKIDCLLDGRIALEDKIYNLDLLSDINYPDNVLNNNMLSEYQVSLGESSVRK